AAGSRSMTVCTSRRSASNMSTNLPLTPAEGVERGGAQRPGDDVGGVLAILREPVHGVLDLLRLQAQQLLDGPAGHPLAGRAGRRDGRPAAVRLEPHLGHAPVAYPQEEPRQVAAALVLVHARPVRVPHQPGVPQVQADPADMPMPFRSRSRTIDSDSTPRYPRLAVPGSRSVGWPLRRTSGTRARMPSHSRSRRAVRRACSSFMSRPRISTALPKP